MGSAPRPRAGSPRAARASRSSASATSTAVAADCPGSITFEADVTDRDALDAAVSGTVERVRRDRHAVRQRRHRRPGLRPHAWTRTSFERVIEVNLIGVLAHDPRLPAARDRAPRLRPPGRVDGRDPAAGRARRLRRGEVGRRERSAHALRVETQHYGVDVGVAYFSWIDTEMVRGADRTELGASMRAMLTRPAGQAPTRSARRPRRSCAGSSAGSRIVAVPRWLIGADVAQADPPAADRARAAQRHRPLRRAGRARGPRARERAGGRGRRGRAGRGGTTSRASRKGSGAEAATSWSDRIGKCFAAAAVEPALPSRS